VGISEDMFSLVVALTILAAPPRGFVAAHTVELIEQVDARLPKWFEGGGDRKTLLATQDELQSMATRLGAAEAAQQNQSALPTQKTFTATRVLVQYIEPAGAPKKDAPPVQVSLHFFDDSNLRCEVPLLVLGTKASPRYVLISGPRIDMRALDELIDSAKVTESMIVYAEKKAGVWTTGSRPAPPPPDCKSTMKNALQTLLTAERAYFTANDSAYTKSVTKLGVDLKKLGITSAKASVFGSAPAQTLVLEVGLRGGVSQMNEKGEFTLLGDCTP